MSDYVPGGPYVYALSGPDGQVFYVGKGRGRRMFVHEREARLGRAGPRFDRIRSIIEAGGEVDCEVLEEFDTDREAGDAEIRYIASFHGLLNRTKGGEIGCIQVDAREVLKRRAQLMLRRAEKAGNGDHPLVALVRAEAENPSPNVLSWGDDGRPVFGWRADKPSVHPSCKMKRGGVYA